MIQDIYTDKSRYNPGETVNVTVELKGSVTGENPVLTLCARHMLETVWRQDIPLTGAGSMLEIPAALPGDDFTGYALEAYVWDGNALLDYAMSAIDVSSDWNMFPRYGYITKLDNRTDREIAETLDRLKKHHINGLFYYDVFDTQEKPLAGTVAEPAVSWKSLAGQTVTRDSLLKTIQGGHDRNMGSFFYNPVSYTHLTLPTIRLV